MTTQHLLSLRLCLLSTTEPPLRDPFDTELIPLFFVSKQITHPTHAPAHLASDPPDPGSSARIEEPGSGGAPRMLSASVFRRSPRNCLVYLSSAADPTSRVCKSEPIVLLRVFTA
eukprot:83955-Hanusia_phi.AAC.1